tara:strand:- start:1056 stop:1439 length:384 start_codon:yes stop_codon:yes gene_type:complete
MDTADSLIDCKNNEVNFTEEKKEVNFIEVNPSINRSASVNMKILEHRFKVEDDRYKDTWKSCCMVLDRRAVQYFTQIAIIGGTMGFSIAQLYRNETCEGQQAYLGLLTLLIGILIPNPKFNDKNSED